MEAQVTAEYISQKFKELVRVKHISEISVSLICRYSTVNRSTFYYYFSSREDLIRWTVIHDISSRFFEASPDTWLHNVTLLLNEFHQNSAFYLQVLHGSFGDTLRQTLYTMTCTTNRQGIRAVLQDQTITEPQAEFITAFYAHAFTGMYLDYIEAGAREDPEIYASRFIPLVDQGFFPLISSLVRNTEVN